MQFEELRFITQQAALDVAGRYPRPVPPTVVLPGPTRTLLLALPGFPSEDELRHHLLAELAAEHLTGPGVPCWGFVAEADVAGTDGIVAVFGARRHPPGISAALFTPDGGLDEFLPSEPLDPTAMPFLHPLQHAVDALSGAQDVFDRYDPKRAGPEPGSGSGTSAGPSGLPLFPG